MDSPPTGSTPAGPTPPGGPAPAGELEQLGPVARMMIAVAGHAITTQVQLRALAELLIERGVITREELEQRYAQLQGQQLDQTIDEWFTADIAYHLKMAIHSARSTEGASQE
jgi:hypothetical protein